MPAPDEFKTLLATPEPPELGPGPRRGVQPLAVLRRALEDSFPGQSMVHALILLWHDHSDAAHEICQEVGTPDGSWVHGILHRREPDFGNARYWFRRVGRHAAFPEMARRVEQMLRNRTDDQLTPGKLVAGGSWDAMAFVDSCERATLRPDAQRILLLREIQAAEFAVLLEHLSGTVRKSSA